MLALFGVQTGEKAGLEPDVPMVVHKAGASLLALSADVVGVVLASRKACGAAVPENRLKRQKPGAARVETKMEGGI